MRFWLWVSFGLVLFAGLWALIHGEWLWLALMCFLGAFDFYLASSPGPQKQ